MGISGKKMTSIVFLLATLLIALTLGSLTFLINDNAASLPNVGLEGNKNMEEDEESMSNKERENMEEHMKALGKNVKNAPPHAKK